jgi:hypothetical protein
MRTIKIILIVGFSYCFAEMAFSIQPSSKKMPEAITAKDLEGKIDFSLTIVDVLGKSFEVCEGDIVDVRICEKRKDEFKKEIVGKLIYFKDFPPHEVCGKCYVPGYKEWEELCADYPPCIAMRDYDVQKHIGTFTIYYPVVSGTEGNFSNCTVFPSYLLFLTYEPSRMLTLNAPPHETLLPFKTFSKKFQTDEEARHWKEKVDLQVEYIIKIKKPFKLYISPILRKKWGNPLLYCEGVVVIGQHGGGGNCGYCEGLVGDIAAYRVTAVKWMETGKAEKEVLLSYPGEDWWKVIDEMKEREEMKKEQKEEGE